MAKVIQSKTQGQHLWGNETNVHAQGDHLLANRKSPSQRWILIISFFLQYVCKPEILGSNALFYVCSEKDLELLKYPASRPLAGLGCES